MNWQLYTGCLLAGILPLIGKWLANDFQKTIYGLVITVIYLYLTIYIKRLYPKFWKLSLAFLVFAFIQFLNNTLPSIILSIIHENSVPGNPLASTINGTVIIQLLDTVIAIVPIIIFTKFFENDLSFVYLNKGKMGKWLIFSIIAFIICYFGAYRISSRHLFPISGEMSFARLFSLSPALLIMVISNGFQEELLFRGLFLKRYNAFFGPIASNVLQAVIFAVAHLGVTYTPSAFALAIMYALPLGLFTGYLMRKTDSVLIPSIFHAELDIPIYLEFLSFVS